MDCTIIFPNNLFLNKKELNKNSKIFIFQDPLFFKDVKYPIKFNKKKILMHLLSTENYTNELIKLGYDADLITFDNLNSTNYVETFLRKNNIRNLKIYEIVDYELKKRFESAALSSNVRINWMKNPLFLLDFEEVEREFKDRKKFLMANFYKKQRKKFNILIDNGGPVGEKWSFDDENRKRFDPKVKIPDEIRFEYDENLFSKNFKLVNKYFNENYGNLDDFNFPINSEQANLAFDYFLENKLDLFGDYEDSISSKENFIFHSLLSQYMNIGLLTPLEVINKTLDYHEKNPVRLNSLEGFIRQVIGWREFIRGIYSEKGVEQRNSNSWNFNNKIPDKFYAGTTGLPPVDKVIKSGIQNSYSHHIERLMIMGNIMMLLEFDPNEVYKWFMEVYVDSYDWVMVPNIYGMSQFSDNGLMATKPYISSSKYILKMSDYKEDDWCKIWDALYWRFIKKHEKFFKSNPRLSLMVNIYEKKPEEMKKNYEKICEEYILSLYK
tara:strand:+ start:3548 stop:5032 length:1485 start_codon:yes stop_codon:yes gene_type:complete